MKTKGMWDAIQSNEINYVSEIINRIQNVNTYSQLINATEKATEVVRKMANQRSERTSVPEEITKLIGERKKLKRRKGKSITDLFIAFIL